MADEEMPELATNEYWRGVMARARKEHGLSQGELGKRVGVSQAQISDIETKAGSSRYILRICRELDIPAPEHFADEEDRDWNELGRLLRARDPEQYDAQRRSLEVIVKRLPEPAENVTEDDANDEYETDEPKVETNNNGSRQRR